MAPRDFLAILDSTRLHVMRKTYVSKELIVLKIMRKEFLSLVNSCECIKVCIDSALNDAKRMRESEEYAFLADSEEEEALRYQLLLQEEESLIEDLYIRLLNLRNKVFRSY